MIGCLAKIRPLDVVTGTRVDVRVSTFGRRDGSIANGTGGVVWEPSIIQAPSIGLTLWNGDFTESIEPAGATLPINLKTVRITFPDAATYMWMGAPIEIYAGEPGSIDINAPIFRGVVKSYGGAGVHQTLQCEVDTEPFNANVLTQTYAGTGGAEGGADLKNRVKPLVLGHARNVEPLLINAADNVYQFSAYGPIEAVDALFERGASFGASVGDFASYAALVTATIAEGRWGTCLAQGMVRLGAPAAGVITGDVKGHAAAGGNLLRWSEAFNNPAWGKFNLEPVAVDSVTAPDGTTTADKLVATTANLEHYAEQTIPVSSNQTYTQSIYVKPDAGIANISFGVIHVGDLSATLTRWRINNAGGTLSDGGTIGPLALSCSLIPLSNGWWRISMRYTLSGTITSHRLRIYAIAGSLPHDTIEPGDGTSGLAVWGAQVRVGVLAGGYTKTEDTASAGSTPRLTGEVVDILSALAAVDPGLIEAASLSALDVDKPYPINLALSDQTSFLDIAQRLIRPCNWIAGVSTTGKFFAADVDMGGTEAITLDAQGKALPIVVRSEELDVSPPYAKTIMGAARSWRVHTSDEIAWNAEIVYLGRYDDTKEYREGNVVNVIDGSEWIYIAVDPSTGNEPPAWPATSNAWWENMTPPSSTVSAELAIRSARVHSPRDASNNPRYMLTATTSGSTSTISVARHDWDYPNGSADVTRALNTITALLPNTEYYVFFDDSTLASTNPSYDATMSAALAENKTATPYRHPLGKIKTPAVGAGATQGGAAPGVAYQYIGWDTAGVVNSYNARNARNSAPIPAPTIATDGSAVDHTINASSTADVSFEFGWSGNNADISEIRVTVYASTLGTSYTPGATPAAETTYIMPPNRRAFIIYGVQPTLFYTFDVEIVRKVDPDIAVSGEIKSARVKPSLGAENPYRPSTTTAFAGNVTGTVSGTAASTVASGAIAGGNAADSAGIIKTSRVRTGSVQNQALVAAGYAVQGAQIVYGPSATDDNAWGATVSVLGARAVIDVVFNWRIQITNPTLRQEMYFDVQPIVIRFSDGVVIGNGMPQRISYIWQGAAASGTYLTERRTVSLQDTFDGLNAGNYNGGFRIVTPAGWRVSAEPYRYVKLNDLRATE